MHITPTVNHKHQTFYINYETMQLKQTITPTDVAETKRFLTQTATITTRQTTTSIYSPLTTEYKMHGNTSN